MQTKKPMKITLPDKMKSQMIECAHPLMPSLGHLIDLELNVVSLSIFFLGLMEINFAFILLFH